MTDTNETEVLICECSSVEHQIVITYCSDSRPDIEDENGAIMEDCMDVNIHLNPSHGFWTRVGIAFRYIFGHRSHYGDWDNFLMNPKDAEKLIPYLERLRDNHKLVEAKLEERKKKINL